MKYAEFIGFKREHMPCPMRKTTMKKVWEAEPRLLDSTARNRFRTSEDVNQYIFRYWELAAGSFVPRKFDILGKCIHLRDKQNAQLSSVCDMITSQKYDMICVNDAYSAYEEFENGKQKVNASLQAILGEKSGFEL